MSDGMMDWNGGWHYGWSYFGVLHMALWVVLIVLGIIALARSLGGRGRHDRPSEDRALSILRERYARGEIDQAEFETRRKDLMT